MSRKSKNYFSKSRLEAFSDAVFAILITLLVLELKVPEITNELNKEDLWKGLYKLSPKFLSWVMSFLTICVIWVNHNRFFRHFKVIDHGVFWWNAIFLLFTSFIPFPTAVLGDYPLNQIAILLYGGVMTGMGLSFACMRIYAIKEGNMFEDNVDLSQITNKDIYSFLWSPAVYLFGSLASYISVYLSYAVFIFIPIYFFFPKGMYFHLKGSSS